MKRTFALKASAALLATLILTSAGCTNTPTDKADNTAVQETEMNKETEAITVASDEKLPVEAADGIFESPTQLIGFEKEKNSQFIKGEQCTVSFNPNGSLTLTGKWDDGKAYFCPKLDINYFQLMQKCYPEIKKTSDLPNGGENNKYRSAVIIMEADDSVINECELYYESGTKKKSVGSVLPTVYRKEGSKLTYLIFDLNNESFTKDFLSRLILTWGWASDSNDFNTPSATVYSVELFPALNDAWTAVGAEQSEKKDHGTYPLNISSDDLNPLIKDIFSGDRVQSETVMFIDAGDKKELLFDIDKVISVSSYDNKITYKEGIDYAVKDGNLVALEGGSLPIITSQKYYNAGPSSLLQTNRNGFNVYTHWGEGREMTDWQVNVTYTHSESWSGFDQPCYAERYADFIKKLQNGEDVTVVFYGDSCTNGAASSYNYNYAPYQYSYAFLVTEALADLFGYTVNYIAAGKSDTCSVPKNYVAGNRGTITFFNPSVGGWRTGDGVEKFEEYLEPFLKNNPCDLFVLDLGGNDGSAPSESVRHNDELIIEKVLRHAPDTDTVIMTTLISNPNATNGWHGTEFLQEPQLIKAAESLNRRGITCAVCQMTSMTVSVLDRVEYNDISGNNINHPNDFFARIYACTLLETLIGYTNLD